MKKKKNQIPTDKALEAVRAYCDESSLQTDPNGSYTGVCAEEREKPVQDADDL